VLNGLQSPFDLLREPIKNENPYSRYYFYLANNFAVSDKVTKWLGHAWVVCDRYVYSTQAYHSAAGVQSLVPLEDLDLVGPDCAFWIRVDESLRHGRIENQRAPKLDEELLKSDFAMRSQIERAFSDFRMTEIDNSTPDPMVAIEAMLNVVLQ
jgi:thymidylate kinase